jgi:hypothetical protein
MEAAQIGQFRIKADNGEGNSDEFSTHTEPLPVARQKQLLNND